MAKATITKDSNTFIVVKSDKGNITVTNEKSVNTANDPTEDFTTYTEGADPLDQISVTETTVTVTNGTRNRCSYLYKDMGVDYFDGEFTHSLAFKLVGYTNQYCAYMFYKVETVAFCGYGTNAIEMHWYRRRLYLGCKDAVTGTNSDYYTYNHNDWRYIKVHRQGDGTTKAYVYSDAIMTNLVATLSVTTNPARKYRYILGCSSVNVTPSGFINFQMKNLRLSIASGTIEFKQENV